MSGTGIELVVDLGYLLLMCAGVGAIAYIFRQPLVLGFLIAGILIGPFGPFPLIKNLELLNSFSDIAIVLLLFGVGLSFPLSQLRAVGRIGAVIAIVEIFVMLGLGFVGSAFGWSIYDAMFLAAALSISSTAIIVKVLEEMGAMESTSSCKCFDAQKAASDTIQNSAQVQITSMLMDAMFKINDMLKTETSLVNRQI